ncbi:MAG: hypothetical protein QOD03_1342 [Verrucomicrobiota bacterium]
MVGQPGQKSPLRRAAPHGDQQVSRPENLPGLGSCRTVKTKSKLSNDVLNIVNLSGRGDKDVAQVAYKVGLQMPK